MADSPVALGTAGCIRGSLEVRVDVDGRRSAVRAWFSWVSSINLHGLLLKAFGIFFFQIQRPSYVPNEVQNVGTSTGGNSIKVDILSLLHVPDGISEVPIPQLGL